MLDHRLGIHNATLAAAQGRKALFGGPASERVEIPCGATDQKHQVAQRIGRPSLPAVPNSEFVLESSEF